MPRHNSLAQFELFVLLSLVRQNGSAFGAELRREIADRTGRGVSLGAMYATLSRLEERRFVSHEISESRPLQGGRARKRFLITADGAAEVQTAVDQLRGMLEDLPCSLAVTSR